MLTGQTILSLSGIVTSPAHLKQQLVDAGVLSPDQETEQFLQLAAEDTSTGTYACELRIPSEFGLRAGMGHPTIADCYRAAAAEGLQVGVPALAFLCAAHAEPVLRPGSACLVSMEPFTVESEFCPLYLSQIQTIGSGDNKGKVLFRMVGGSLAAKVNPALPILFFRKLS